MNKLFFFPQGAKQTIYFPKFAEQSFFYKKTIAPPPRNPMVGPLGYIKSVKTDFEFALDLRL